jgi:hypothetical protein
MPPKFVATFLAALLIQFQLSAAPGTPQMLIESLNGPVTSNELSAAKSFALTQSLPVNNHGNNLVYGRSHEDFELLARMFEITGDRDYLNRLVEFSDAILACRNNTNTGDLFWTSRREPTWSSGTAMAGGTNYQTTHVESGAILELLAHCSQLIITHKELWNETVPVADPLHLGRTYIERARSYIRESNFTIDSFILPWSVKEMTNGVLRMYFSDSPELKRMGGRAGNEAGRPIPWNQQFMLVRGLVRLAEDMQALNEDTNRIALYDKISRCSLNWFTSELHQTNINGEVAYTWSYMAGDRTLHYIENTPHGSSDVEGMYVCYKSGRFGILPAMMRGFANTALLLAHKDGQFMRNVDGSGGPHGLSTAWLPLAEFRPELYILIAGNAVARLADPQMGSVLKWKYDHVASPAR